MWELAELFIALGSAHGLLWEAGGMERVHSNKGQASPHQCVTELGQSICPESSPDHQTQPPILHGPTKDTIVRSRKGDLFNVAVLKRWENPVASPSSLLGGVSMRARGVHS